MTLTDPVTIDDVLAYWPSIPSMAGDLGISPFTVYSWRYRGSIAHRYWQPIVDAAAARGYDGITYDSLRGIAERSQPIEG